MKKRDFSMDCIRILGTLFIMYFHFFSSYDINISVTKGYANGTWGYLGTCIFFMLSGYLLQSRYSEKTSIWTFYKKRWLSIYPSFYLAFLGAFLFMGIFAGNFFYGGSVYGLIYSVLGIDKYVNWFGIVNYSTVGEWFTAVIVVLYIIFPLLEILFKRARLIFSIVLFAAYLLVNLLKVYTIPDITLINAVVMFWAGMLLARYGEKLRSKKLLAIIYGVLVGLLFFVYIPIGHIFTGHLMALSLFLLMYTLIPSENVSGKLGKTATFFAGLSYEIYLVHHFLMLVIDSGYNKLGFIPPYILRFLVYTVLVVFVAFALNRITGFIIRLPKAIRLKKQTKNSES